MFDSQGHYRTTKLQVFQSNATADGNGNNHEIEGTQGLIEIQKTGTGTTTAILEGTFSDPTEGAVVWYSVGYQQVDAIGNPTRSVAAFALATGTQNHVLQPLDIGYIWYRLRLASTAGAVSVTAGYNSLSTT